MATEIKGLDEVKKALDGLSRIAQQDKIKITIRGSFEDEDDPWDKKWIARQFGTLQCKKRKNRFQPRGFFPQSLNDEISPKVYEKIQEAIEDEIKKILKD